MRITTFDPETAHGPCDLEVPLRRLAASAEPMEAAYWRKLLELVERLRSNGSEPVLWGLIVSRQLVLSKPEPPDSVRDRKMKEFMDEWRALNPDPSKWGRRLAREMRKRFPREPGVSVNVWVDWQDYGPLREGFPEMHYRFQVKQPGKTITEDARSNDPQEAERIICTAFGF